MSDPLDQSGLPEVIPPNPKVTPAARWAIVMAVVVAVGLVVYLGAQPVYRRLKQARGVRVAHEAIAQLEAGDYDGAAKSVRTAQRFAPGDIEVSRVTARVSAAVGQPAGLAHWVNVVNSGRATLDDLVEASEMALRFGRVDLSGAWLRMGYAQAPKDRRLLRLMQRHLLRMGDRPRAVQFARGLLRDNPLDPELEFELGRLLSGGPEGPEQAEGLRLLWGLAAGGSEFQLPAAEVLSRTQGLGRAEAESLVRVLEQRTNAPVQVVLLAFDLRIRLDPSAKPAAVRRALGMLPGAVGAAETGAVVNWLNRQGAVSEVLPLVPLERCRTNAILMAARLDALAALGLTNELARITTESMGPLNVPLAKAAQAMVAFREGRRVEAESLLREALRSRPRLSPVLLFIATQSEGAGMNGVALEAYQELMAIPATTLDAARNVLRLAKPLDDLRVSLDALRSLNAYMPGEEVVAGERAWLEAILGEEKVFAFTTLSNLARTRTNQPAWRYGLALATWRHGDAAGGLQLMEQSPLDWDRMEPRWQVAYVALLGANQQREAARKFGRQIDLKRLHAQERALVEPWL